MANVMFVSEQYVKDNTIIDDNMDSELLKQIIVDSQEEYILPILGTGLYNELVTQIDAASVSADNTTLLNTYIQKALKYWVVMEATDIIVYKYKNKGVLKQTGDKTFTVDVEEIKRLQDKWKNKAEIHSEKAAKYLIENSTTYPLYLNPGTGVDIVHPRKDQWRSGIYLGGASGAPGASKPERYENGDII